MAANVMYTGDPQAGQKARRLLNQAAGAKRQQHLRVEHRDNLEAAQLGAL